MLPVLCGSGCDSVADTLVAVVGDDGAGEVERAVVVGGDHLYGVGVGDVLGRTEDFEGGDCNFIRAGRVGEGCQQSGEVLRLEERLVALDIDVDVGVAKLSDGVEAVGAGGQVGRGHLDGPAVAGAEIGYLFGVGRDQDLVELGAGASSFVDPCQHGASGDAAKDFAG